MSKTNHGTRSVTARRRKTPTRITAHEALQLLESALSYCQAAGMEVQAGNGDEGTLAIYIPNAHYTITDNGTRAEIRRGEAPDAVWDAYHDAGQIIPRIGASAPTISAR